MSRICVCVCAFFLLASCVLPTAAQQAAGVSNTVPSMVNFSGVLTDATGKPLTGAVGVTFSLYKESQGGSPLWMETQNVQADKAGHYSVALGSTKSQGVPADLFASGEARWLGVQAQGQAEQPRVLLMSVPYALKALDAETIGGKPASAFMLAPVNSAGSSQNNVPPDGTITGGGTANFVPLFTGTTTIGNSKVFQTAGGDIGIGTTTPAATLDVKGKADVRDTLTLIPKATHPTLSIKGTAFAVSSTGVVTFADGQTFPGTGTIIGVTAGTDLTGGGNSGNVTLNVDTTKVVTAIVAGTDLTGGGTGGVQTLNLDTTKVPQLNAANTFTANQNITGNLTASGTVTGAVINAVTSFNLGGSPFAFGSSANFNAFLGFAGNSTTTGAANSAVGWLALASNTSGGANNATGYGAMISNTTGGNNEASGVAALQSNTTGGSNTADGSFALSQNTTANNNTGAGFGALQTNVGPNNTAVGANAGEPTNYAVTTGANNTFLGFFAGPGTQTNLNNATAIGANAVVGSSNSMVLGGTGSNAVNVGIGTATPASTLDVHGTGNFTGLITFASGQTFPGTGTITGVTAGTALTGGGSSGGVTLNVDTTKVVTGITAGIDLTGGGTGGVQTLNLDTTKVPLLNAANSFTANQSVTGNLTVSGQVSGGVVNAGTGFSLGGNTFAFGNPTSQNLFLGFSAGNATTTGNDNTGIGEFVLFQNSSGSFNTGTGDNSLSANTTGLSNTADGYSALLFNTSGSLNTAVGGSALQFNNTGSGNSALGSSALNNNSSGFSNTAMGSSALYQNTSGRADTAVGAQALYSNNGVQNTAVGISALFYNTTGSSNTALGYLAGSDQSVTNLTNATAIGAFSDVTQSNSLVLGSINGINNATADTNVGIGTTQPQTLLHIDHAPASGGQDVVLVTSGGSSNVASMLLQSTAPGQRLRVGAGTDAAYLASSGILEFFTADTGSPNSPTGPTMTMDTSGNVHIPGNLSKGGGSFEIDHPLDPANKYLYHSFVESPDMMNVYNGNVTTDRRGLAEIALPDYFDALNRDFRYQLTVIGQFAQAIVAKEISHNRFTIRTSRPGVKVSWQVTGIRQDAYANAHRIPVEVEKPPQEQGKYLHPELFGAPQEARVGHVLSLPPATGIRQQVASSAVSPK